MTSTDRNQGDKRRSTQTAIWLVLVALLYAVLHYAFPATSQIRDLDDAARLEPSGEITIEDTDALRACFSPENWKAFDQGSVEQRNRDIAEKREPLRSAIAEFNEHTLSSCPEDIAIVQDALFNEKKVDYERAANHWNDALAKLSTGTRERLGAVGETTQRTLRGLVIIAADNRDAFGKATPSASAAYVWTTPGLAKVEIVLWAIMGGLASLIFRGRRIERRGLRLPSASLKDVSYFLLVPLAALLVYLVWRPGKDADDAAFWIVLIGLGTGLVLPLVGRTVASLTGRDPDAHLVRAQRTDSRSKIQLDMSNLHAESFADLKQAARDFARRLITTEAEEDEARS